MLFSQRINKTNITPIVQKDSINKNLRCDLWNIFHLIHKRDDMHESFGYGLCEYLYLKYYHQPIDEINNFDSYNIIKNKIFNDTWFRVYDFLEITADFINRNNSKYNVISYNVFLDNCNVFFEMENSAYRFVNGIITPITNDIETNEIETSINDTFSNTAAQHIETALKLLSDRKHPDYRNSIKESISAVEAVCRYITNESTLDKALPKLKNKGIIIPDMLEEGMKKIYYFTNGEAGIRHALMDESIDIDFEEAKYMLVVCSAFVNYLKAKSGKANA